MKMAEYFEREAALALVRPDAPEDEKTVVTIATAKKLVRDIVRRTPAADVAPVVRCKDCKHSTLPSELTQRYGKPGTLTCHNMHAPSNRRNVGSNDFCSYGARMDGDSDAKAD